MSVIPALCNGGHAKPVAFCDVDFKRKGIEKMLQAYPDVPRFADFRVMLDQMGDDIDAVSIVTPDHAHYVQTLEAMRRGKHVYVEKPLTHSFQEAEFLMRAEKKYGVVTQMGNQGHTSSGAAQFRQLVESGAVRDIVKIDAFKSPSLWFMDANQRISDFPPQEAIPESLDYELWCGPAEMKPFNKRYHPFDWRAFYLYGNGMLGDWGAHIIDFAHDYLRLGLPTRVEALEMEDHNSVIFPLSTRIGMHFPKRGAGLPACDMIWADGNGAIPGVDETYWNADATGEKKAPGLGGAGTLLHRKDEQFIIQRGSHNGVSRLYPKERMRDYRKSVKAPKVPYTHMESFVRACMGEGKTNSPFSVSGELTQVLMLGVISQYLNESFDFDPKTKRITNNPKAQALLAGPPPRKGWEGYYRAGS
jgi:predicted dehydrogenase